MTPASRIRKYDWRAVLTDEERRTIEAGDEAKKVWLALNRERAGIMNRAIQRAKYRQAALKQCLKIVEEG